MEKHIVTVGPNKLTKQAKLLGFTVGELFGFAQQRGYITTRAQIKFAYGYLDEYQQFLNEIQPAASSVGNMGQ